MNNETPGDVQPRHEAVYEQRVPLHDCDPLGIVWHGHYYKYLEIARTVLFEGLGIDVAFFQKNEIRLVIMESRCRHSFPLRMGETLRVTAWFQDYEQRLRVAYHVHNLDHDRRAARAWTTLVATTPDETLLMETPDAIANRIRTAP